MKLQTLLLLIWLLPKMAQTQNIVIPDGEFMDTTFVKAPLCDDAFYHFYYSVNGKYPKNSAALIKEAKAFLKNRPTHPSVNGYITFRFKVNCEGGISSFRVLQTDDAYKETHFDKNLVSDLHQFVETLSPWTLAHDEDRKPVNYIAFISFKIRNGNIIAIIP